MRGACRFLLHVANPPSPTAQPPGRLDVADLVIANFFDVLSRRNLKSQMGYGGVPDVGASLKPPPHMENPF